MSSRGREEGHAQGEDQSEYQNYNILLVAFILNAVKHEHRNHKQARNDEGENEADEFVETLFCVKLDVRIVSSLLLCACRKKELWRASVGMDQRTLNENGLKPHPTKSPARGRQGIFDQAVDKTIFFVATQSYKIIDVPNELPVAERKLAIVFDLLLDTSSIACCWLPQRHHVSGV